MGVDVEPVSVQRAPTRLSSGLATVFGIAATVAVARSTVGLIAGVIGLLALILGLGVLHSKRPVHVAGLALVGGPLTAGAMGLAPVSSLIGAVFGVLAWDTAENAVVVGRQLGRRADTTRTELVHVAASGLVTATVAIIGYVTFRLSHGRQPLAALALLVFGALFVLWAWGR